MIVYISFTMREILINKIINGITCATPGRVHGGHKLPLVSLRVVALYAPQAVGAVEAAYGIEKAVDDGHTHPDAPRLH